MILLVSLDQYRYGVDGSGGDSGKSSQEDTVYSSCEFKKHRVYIGPDKPREPKSYLTNIGINFKSIPYNWCFP